MTTAQERRRARRLARNAAQGLDSPPADAVVAAEDPIATGGTETMLNPPTDPIDTLEPPAAADPPEPAPAAAMEPPEAREPLAPEHSGHRWNRVTARPSSAPARAHTGERPHGWVAVKPRRVSADATEVHTTEPMVGETLAPLPIEAHDSRDSHSTRPANGNGNGNGNGHVYDEGSAAPLARALHPRSRAIRITRVKTNGRRRWSVDFLVRKADDANQA